MYWYIFVYILMAIMMIALYMGGKSGMAWSVNGK